MVNISRIEAFRFNNTGIVKVGDGFEWRFDGNCIAKIDSNGNFIIKGDITTNESNPCA